MMKRYLLFAVYLLSTITTQAAEGMWMPLLLEKYTIKQMQASGFKLTAEDIYSINQASLKDAILIFGSGCTGEVVSDKGLIMTNHHCGLSAIQSHSTLAHDYVADGFWAMNNNEELTNPELSVTFLKKIEDVTAQILKDDNDTITETQRQKNIKSNIAKLQKEAEKESGYSAEIKPYFNGNQYFMSLYQKFEDVRLVGTPPAAIGKFGGDTDNWMWPRHTGDFCLFRIYANSKNEPAAYSPDNVPYRPAKHLEISLKGVKEDDFTMVIGFPGTTNQYVPSYHIKMLKNDIYPYLIDIRSHKLDIMERWMTTNRDIRIKYISKEAKIANAWKKWKGESRGLEKLKTIALKQEFETNFSNWASLANDSTLKRILPLYKNLYADYSSFKLTENYLMEMIWSNGMELVEFAGNFKKLNSLLKNSPTDTAAIKIEKENINRKAELFYKNYHAPLDKEMTIMLLNAYQKNIPPMFQPSVYNKIDKQYNGKIEKYVSYLMEQSQLLDSTSIKQLVNTATNARIIKTISKDPAYQLYLSFYEVYANHLYPLLSDLNKELTELNRQYMAAQMEYSPDKIFYPDANFTMRLTYGNVKGYEASDAVSYSYFSTIDGIMEKENPDIDDYQIPTKLKELYNNKDFGDYSTNNTIPVCFIATNHTTGGNSGSPVLNASGQLIGINFDRVWEGVMSDFMYNPQQSRNIAVDIRYILFIIDKYANASYLLNEMTLCK